MDFLAKIEELRYRSAYFLWVGVFFIGVIALVGTLYYATAKIDYSWHWFDVPKYFVNQERIDRILLRHGDELQVGKFRLVFFERNDA